MEKDLSREVAAMKVIRGVRGLFHELRAVAQELHGGSSLAGGRRGVLVDLLEDGEQTVPELARRRPVTRQHIQVLVNQLLRDELVERRPNPEHKRSHLIGLTPKGRQTIAAMLERELELLQALEHQICLQQLLETAEVLSELKSALRDPHWRASLTGE